MMPMQLTKEKHLRYTVVFEPEDDGGFHIHCPALPGCHTYGRTKSEALKNIKEAMRAYLESLKKDGLPYPKDVAQEVEVAA